MTCEKCFYAEKFTENHDEQENARASLFEMVGLQQNVESREFHG